MAGGGKTTGNQGEIRIGNPLPPEPATLCERQQGFFYVRRSIDRKAHARPLIIQSGALGLLLVWSLANDLTGKGALDCAGNREPP